VPLYLNTAETVPALMAGNTVVLKPAQLTPWSGSEYGRIVAEETDIPAGVFNVVGSNANEVGAAPSADPRVDAVIPICPRRRHQGLGAVSVGGHPRRVHRLLVGGCYRG
jgi:delta 1-pyrroline-5-carboxylate dehydrogenase